MPFRLSPFPPALLVCALLAGALACSEPEPPDPEEVALREALGIDGRIPLFRVFLESGSEGEVVTPLRVEVVPGSIVVVETVDWGVHTFGFEEAGLSPEARAFLNRTHQVAGPPLVSRGSRLVLSFEGAPLGSYPYVAQGETGEARGLMIVADPAPPSR